MENITYPNLSNLRRHQRARHDIAAQEGRFNEHETTQTTATVIEAQGHDVSAFSEYDDFGSKDEATLMFQQDLVNNDASHREEDTLVDNGLGFPDWNSIPPLKHDNDFSQISPGHSIYRGETEDGDSALYDSEADCDAAVSLCTDPEEEEEEEEASLCLPEPSYHASEDRSRTFSPRMPLGPGWLDDFINTPFINTPTSRGDREAKAADWSSIIDLVEFEAEDCHSLITLELGVRKQIPMMFEYSQGIREVHRKLRLRYGDDGLKQAFAVFHGIMEFQDPDLVHGDEAPQWNSWRGDYKRRLDDMTSVLSPIGLVLKPKSRVQRHDTMAKILRKAKAREDPKAPGLDEYRVPQGTHALANPSAGRRLASQTNPKVSRSRRVDFKIFKNIHKKYFEKEVEVSGILNVTKKLRRSSFVTNMEPHPVKATFRKCVRYFSRGKSSSMTTAERAEQAEHDIIAPWEEFESKAPMFQDVKIPASDRDPGAQSVPVVSVSRTVGRYAAVKKSMSIASFTSRLKKKWWVTAQNEQAATVKDSGLTFEPSLPAIEEVRATFVTPTPILGPDVPARITQLRSVVHLLTPEEHIAAARQREQLLIWGHSSQNQNVETTPKTLEIAETVKAFEQHQGWSGTVESSAEHRSEADVDPYDRAITPLLPESIVQFPEPNIAIRRRVVRPISNDDDSDDTMVPLPRPRVSIAQRNQEFGWHVPGEAQVQHRPRRAPDPMTPSPELMEHVQFRHVEGRFDPEAFGLGRRRRPENVVVTRHKVKQVYIQQPGLWTPKTSEINF